MSSSNLFTVRQFSEKHRAFSEGGIRWQIFNSDKNGLGKSGAILRIGRKILINEDKYLDWLYDSNQLKLID